MQRSPRLPEHITRRLRIPLIAAPMFTVSGTNLVMAACRTGVIGAFPTANCRAVDELDSWLSTFARELGPEDAPVCANLIIKRQGMTEHLDRLVAHRVEMVITSVGSPRDVIAPLHEVGCLVLADVASLEHARKSIAAGVDGLVLLSAGAGGQTGWANGMAFARAVRSFYDGLIVLAGGVIDGVALRAARVLDCDLGYMGTRFIATQESEADERYKALLVKSSLDDVLLTRELSGLDSNVLRPSLTALGLDPDNLSPELKAETSAMLFAAKDIGPRRWKDIWSAGHSVSGVLGIQSVAELVADVCREYDGPG